MMRIGEIFANVQPGDKRWSDEPCEECGKHLRWCYGRNDTCPGFIALCKRQDEYCAAHKAKPTPPPPPPPKKREPLVIVETHDKDFYLSETKRLLAEGYALGKSLHIVEQVRIGNNVGPIRKIYHREFILKGVNE